MGPSRATITYMLCPKETKEKVNTIIIAYKGDFLSLCTVLFWQKADFLISNAH
jgi:hypothetical protein